MKSLISKMARIICVMLAGVMMVNATDGAAETQYLFYFQDEGESSLYYSSSGSVEEAIEQAGLNLGSNDSYTVENTSRDVYTITVDRADSCYLEADGEREVISFKPGETTVAEILDSQEVVLGEDDIVSHELSELVRDGETIKVSRVTYDTYVANEVIDWEYDYEPTRYLPDGSVKIFESGSDGSKTVEYRRVYVDGELVDEEPISEVVTAKVTNGRAQLGDSDAPIEYLEQPEWLTFDENGLPEQAVDVISGLGTAYTSEVGAYGATGRHLSVGYVAVDPSVIPYGTKLYIKTQDGSWDYGYAIAADTGSAMLSGRILVDQYMNSEDTCMEYGVREVDVYILEDLDAHTEIE